MSIGSFLLNKENLELVGKKSWKFGRAEILKKGMDYFASQPAEVNEIKANLTYMGLATDPASLNRVLEQIVAHYYEKLFVLVKKFEAYWIAQNRITVTPETMEAFKEAQRDNKALFLAQSHYGATYFLAMALNVRQINLCSVGKFPPPVGPMLQSNMAELSAKYHIGTTSFVDLSSPTANAPMEMMSLFLQKKVVSNVFDENNQFCKVHKLLGKDIMGGTGMDMILRNFTDRDLVIITPFLVRNDDESFTFRSERHYLDRGNIIDSFFGALGRTISADPAQWYFIRELHESFPTKKE